MFDVMQLRFDCRHLRRVLQDIVVEVFVVVDLIDELIHTGWELRSAALEWLRANHLAIVDDQFLIERRWKG